MGEATGNIGVDIVEEALDQLTGRSSKKWLILLLAFVLGAAVAAWVIRKRLADQGIEIDDAGDVVDAVTDAVP